MERCAKCGKVLGEYLVTAYGDSICEDCWDAYICSDEGKLEYLIGIARGDYPASEFDDEFLKEAAESWNTNKNLVRNLTHAEFLHIEMLLNYL
jgi:hypothetical protein